MKLHEQVKYFKRAAQLQTESTFELLCYVNSSKFWEDKSVNTSDIRHRILGNRSDHASTLLEEFGELLD